MQYLGTDVLITKDSFKHGAARLDATYLAICKNIDVILRNSIVVNELMARNDTDGGYVLLGLVDTGDDFALVRSVINKRTHRLMEFQQLDAIKKQEIKKIEDVGLRPPDYPRKRGSATSSEISIAHLLSFVKSNNLANEVFSEDVAKTLGIQRAKGSLSESVKFNLKERIDVAKQQTTDDPDRASRELTMADLRAMDARDAQDGPEVKKTGYTYDDVHGILDSIKKESLTFETASGAVEGKIFRREGWDLGKRIYEALKMDELGNKREIARKVASMIVDTAMVNEKGADGRTVARRLSEVLGRDATADAKEAVALAKNVHIALDFSRVS